MSSLLRRHRCRLSQIDVEDAAAEVVMRAFQRFGVEPSSWTHARGWCFVAASHLCVDRLRRHRIVRLDDCVAIETISAPEDPRDLAAACGAAASLSWLQVLRRALCKPDQATFDLLLDGVHDNAVIAELRSRTVRAVEVSRRRIALAAASLWYQGIIPRKRFVSDR